MILGVQGVRIPALRVLIPCPIDGMVNILTQAKIGLEWATRLFAGDEQGKWCTLSAVFGVKKEIPVKNVLETRSFHLPAPTRGNISNGKGLIYGSLFMGLVAMELGAN
jgi:hypothetical protein